MAKNITMIKKCSGDPLEHDPQGIYTYNTQTVADESELDTSFTCPVHPGSELGEAIIVSEEHI